jgi:hypothetical protein
MSQLDRRNFLKLSSATLIGVSLGGISLHALAAEKIKLDDPIAVAMKYVEKSVTAGQNCANCMHVQGKDGDAERPCAIFSGKLVAADGWCAGWAKKA